MYFTVTYIVIHQLPARVFFSCNSACVNTANLNISQK